jgi:valyl-tRNA synthetase
MKLDPRKVVSGTLYSKSAAVEIARGSAGAIQKLAAINLEVVEGPAPVNSGVHAATPEFDLVLRVPAAEAEARREKLGKEKAQLEKARDSSHRQLQNEEFLAKAPPAVIESIRQKLIQYEAQIAKLNQALDGLDAPGNP